MKTFDKDGKRMKRGDRVSTSDGRLFGTVVDIEGGWLGVVVNVKWDDGEPRPKIAPYDLIVMSGPWF